LKKKLIEEAGENNAKIIVFPESYLPAYPRGMSFGTIVGNRSQEGREDFYEYWNNSIQVPSSDTEKIGKAAKKADAYVVIGVIEKDKNKLISTGTDLSRMKIYEKTSKKISNTILLDEYIFYLLSIK